MEKVKAWKCWSYVFWNVNMYRNVLLGFMIVFCKTQMEMLEQRIVYRFFSK